MNFDQAEAHLRSLELFGMSFGLERMEALTAALGNPQEAFASIHVVGTNGKSSTTRMIAEILRQHGRRSGAYLSPHLVSYRERVLVQGEELSRERFAAAVTRAADAAEQVEGVTQFELLTAAAFVALADGGVEVAAIEAGLGGRYDATNVIPSTVQVITNVGLDHTRWLGETVEQIAAEKLAVVKPGGTLVVGTLPDTVTPTADRIVGAPQPPGPYQRRNFALAEAAAEAFLGRLDREAVRRARHAARVPGRLQPVGERPLTLIDAAHNADGIAALLEALPGGHEPVVAAVSILDDKDAAAMLELLSGACSALVLTQSLNPRALRPEQLARLAPAAMHCEIEAEPRAAMARARELAGPDGIAIATGSIYLIADLLRPEGVKIASTL